MLMPRALFVVDSIATAEPAMAEAVVVCGSHGGVSAANYVLALPRMPFAVFFNDAGVGKDNAGIVALALLEARGVIAATYAHTSARIGDAEDGLQNGVISAVNAVAVLQGIGRGEPVDSAVRALRKAGKAR